MLLCGVLYLFTLIRTYAVVTLSRFPKSLQCKYELDKNGHKSFANFDKNATLEDKGIGYYHCYCKAHFEWHTIFENKNLFSAIKKFKVDKMKTEN